MTPQQNRVGDTELLVLKGRRGFLTATGQVRTGRRGDNLICVDQDDAHVCLKSQHCQIKEISESI